jgi:hypothetical protein
VRQITLSTLEFPTEAKARVAVQERVLNMNGPQAFKAKNIPTFGLVIDRFIKEARFNEVLSQPAGPVALTGALAYSLFEAMRPFLTDIFDRAGRMSA